MIYRAVLIGVAALLSSLPNHAAAHEGHAAVPSTGATVEGDTLLLSEAAMSAVGVETEMIQLGDVHQEVHAQARVELPARGRARVTSLASGRLADVRARPGDRVEAGATLASVTSMELERLASQLAQASSEAQYLQRLAEQRRRLAADGAVAGKTLLSTEASLRQYRARQSVLREKVRALGLTQAQVGEIERSGQAPAALPVATPIGGVVQHVDARPGQLVEESEHLFTIVDSGRLYVVAEVLESDAHAVEVGQPMTFLAAGSSEPVRAAVDHVRPLFNEGARAIEVVAEVDNSGGALRPGVLGRASLQVQTAEQEILCPLSAVFGEAGQKWVLLRQGPGKFGRQPVQLGARDSEHAVAESGLFPGQRVVTTGTHLLAAMFAQSVDRAGGETAAEASRVAAPGPGTARTIEAGRGVVELPPSGQAVATSLVEGRVVAIHVKAAEQVVAGQPLAELESQQLRDLQLSLLETQARADWLGEEVQRLGPLVESNVTAARELWDRENELRKAQREIDSLSRRLALVGAEPDSQSGRLVLRAPIGGQTTEPEVILGQLVHSHDVLVEVVDLSTVLVRAVVLEEQAGQVATGLPVTITFAADPHLTLTGHVARVAPQLVSAEQVLPIWIELPNPDGFLKPGMLARVTITVGQISPAISDSAAQP